MDLDDESYVNVDESDGMIETGEDNGTSLEDDVHNTEVLNESYEDATNNAV